MNQNTQNDASHIYEHILVALWAVISCPLSVIWVIFVFVVRSRRGRSRGARGRLSFEPPWKSYKRKQAFTMRNAEYKNLRLQNERMKHEVLIEQKRRLGI